MRRLKFLKMPTQESVLSFDSMAGITLVKPHEWLKGYFGWETNSRLGADFDIKVHGNIEVNGLKILKSNIKEYAEEQMKLDSPGEGIKELSNLVEKIQPATIRCNFNSKDCMIIVESVQNKNLTHYPDLVRDFFTKFGPQMYNNISFLDDEYNITKSQIYKMEGKCPQCGEIGQFHRTALMCSKHGIYGGF